MEETTKNMTDLFALAKNAKVEYPVKNITNIISGSAATGVAASTGSIFNLTNISIMIGSIFTIVAVAVLVNTTNITTNTERENTQVVKTETVKEISIKKQNASTNLPTRSIENPIILNKPMPIETEALIENEIEVEMVENEEPTFVSEVLVVNAQAGNIDPFHTVKLNISTDVILHKGNSHSLDFEGNMDLVELLNIYVENKILYIDIKKGKEKEYNKRCRNKEVDIHLTMEQLNGIIINGSGDIYSPDKIESNDLTININGSGDIKLDKIVPNKFSVTIKGSGDVSFYGVGDVDNGIIDIIGSGDVCTKTMDVSNFVINIIGSGDARVTCQDQLDITIIGSGDVCYSGNATVNSNEIGSGEVRNCSRQ